MSVMVLYGPYHMTNQKCMIHSTNERSHPTQIVEREKIARQDGNIKVSDQYSERSISVTGTVKLPSSDSVNDFRDIENEFDNALSKKSRLFRIARSWIRISDVDDSTNWTAGGDTVNITTDSYNYMVSNKSLNFDFDVDWTSNDYAEIYNSSLSAVDLSGQEDTGNIEFWIFISDNQYITNIDVRWGSDSGNYWYEDTISTNYEGNALETGWNYISVPWVTAETNGSPSSSAVDYFYVRFNYSSLQKDLQNNKLSGIRWINEDKVTNYECDSIQVLKPERHGDITRLAFTANILAIKGLALGTHETHILDRDTQTSVTKTVEVNFLGSYRPKPRIVYTFNTASDITGFIYENLNTDEEISITTAWTASNILTIDTDRLVCQLSEDDVEYEGVFPRHIVGLNKLRTTIITGASETIEQTSGNTEYASGDYNAPLDTGDTWAQGFQVSGADTITYVELYLKRTAASGSDYQLKVSIQTDNGGEPSGTLVSNDTIGYIDASDISVDTYSWNRVYYSGNTNVSIATPYWLVFGWSSGNVPANYGGLEDFGGNPYANGERLLSPDQGTTWLGKGDGNDIRFRVVTGGAYLGHYDWDIYYKKRYV